MLNALKYIIVFLLGYKIIKELFGGQQKKNIKKREEKNHSIQEEKPNNTPFDNAEDIDYEEVK